MKATEKSAKVKERADAFSLDIIRLYQQIKAHNEFVLSRQVLRSGTSIGANMEEASPSRAEKTSVPKCLLPQRKLVKLFIGCVYEETAIFARIKSWPELSRNHNRSSKCSQQ